MNEVDSSGKCKKCGYVHTDNTPPHRLKPGARLQNDRYLVGNALGEGGFGITYIGFDTRLETKIAIKEFFPSGFVTRYVNDSTKVEVSNMKNSDFFKYGKDRFLQEARTVARFTNESGIVNVRDYFEENGTAYIVMEYIDGKNLKIYMREHGVFKQQDILALMKPIFDALEKIHNSGLIHRDISPDNIMFTKDSTLKLMDFGASQNIDLDNTTRGTIILKPGYAPPEQYQRDGNQGTWTDVYALCATMYKCITGITPDEAIIRAKNDELKRISEIGIKISSKIEEAIIGGLELDFSKRIQNISDLKQRIYGDTNPSAFESGDENLDLYIDDNSETMVIGENFGGVLESADECQINDFQDENEETGLLNESIDENEETGLLSESIDENEETGLLSESIDENEETDLLNESIDECDSTSNSEMSENQLAEKTDNTQNKKGTIKMFIVGVVFVVVGLTALILLFNIITSLNKADNSRSYNYLTYGDNSDIQNSNISKASDTQSSSINNSSNTQNSNKSQTAVDIPSVTVTSVSGDIFDVKGVEIEEYIDENSNELYCITFDMEYLVDYEYHSEYLVNSYVSESDCTAYGETFFEIEKSMLASGDYTYKIELFGEADEYYTGEISFTVE
ncbi:MAG: protein kinase [Ruminococcus sp.]